MSPKGWFLGVLFSVSLFTASYGWALIWAIIILLSWESL